MRNKVLVVSSNAEEREWLEQVLQEVATNGGEIFFADKGRDGWIILKKEHPQLAFLDASLVGDHEKEWVAEGVQVIWLRDTLTPSQKEEESLLRPLKSDQVLEKCRRSLSKESAAQIPPM